MTEPTPESVRFRRTLIRVMAMQVGTLIVLWLLQTTFTR